MHKISRFTSAIRYLSLAAITLLISACSSSTTLVQSWQEPTFTGPPIKKVLIMGLFHDPLNRRFFEEEFAAKFSAAGVQAIASYTLIPNPEDFDEEKEVAAIVKQADVDSVLIAELKAIDKEEKYVPPRVEMAPGPAMYGGMYGGGFYGHYYQSYQTVYRPGYKKVDTIARMETSLYTTADNKLIWAGKTESMNPDSRQKAIKEIAQTLTKDMKDRGILK